LWRVLYAYLLSQLRLERVSFEGLYSHPIQGLRVFQGELDSVAKLFHPIRMTSDASLPFGPISGRQVMQYEFQVVIM
jgi:hypothetical protein